MTESTGNTTSIRWEGNVSLKYKNLHMKIAGLCCPTCGRGDDLTFQDFEAREDGEITQEGECRVCHCRWLDIFRLVCVTELVPHA